MDRLSAADIVKDIAKLNLSQIYTYPSGRSQLQLKEIPEQEGPIKVQRWDVGKKSSEASISVQKISKAALVFSARPNYPIHFDRLFSAGGNDRSAFETLLAYTPHFFICYPDRVDLYTGEVKRNLKHIMWCPDEIHDYGVIAKKPYSGIISEFELESNFGDVGDTTLSDEDDFDSIEAKKTHTQIQVALVEIGNALNFKTWIAAGDRSFSVGDRTLGSLDGVIQSLDEIKIFYDTKIKEAARLIDCIWFTTNADIIPAIIEVEHSTGVTPGLTRMLKFKETIPSLNTTFTIVAHDKLRTQVVTKSNEKIFRKLDARFMSYTTVRMLYGLIQKYSLAGYVDESFVQPFMERVVDK